MDSITRYAAVNAKVRALQGKLLKDEDFVNLLSKKSVPEVTAYLKQNTHFHDEFEDINEGEIHRADIENLLKKSHIEGMDKIVHYFHDEYREFYKTLFIRYEIEDLKAMLRGIKAGSDNSALRNSFIFIGKYSKMDVDSLVSSKTLPDLVKSLKGTVYYDYLRPLMENNEGSNMFGIAMTLDLAYFDLFYKSLKGVGKYDKEVIDYIQGTNVDLLNLQWVYRGLKFYKLSSEELFNYTIPYGLKFKSKDIKELCYLKDLEEYQKRVLRTRYKFLFDNEDTKDIFMERRILRYQYFLLKGLKRRDGMNISQVIAYILLSEYEGRDIISVIESIRYGMPMEEARKFLIRKI